MRRGCAVSDKRLERLKSLAKDFTWDELKTLLERLGYEMRAGKGSRRRFMDKGKNKILLHEPHPQKVLKEYQMKQVLEQLQEHGKI